MILKILKIFTGIALFMNITIAMAAEIHHFDVIVNPTKIAVGEATDLTISAIDKDNNIIKDYEGTILIFSESDKKAEFPNAIEDNSYTFSKSDEGTVKFENAVKFTKIGKNDIKVYDLGDQTDSVFGLAEIEVTEKSIRQNMKIEILSPGNGITIGKSEINISGKSTKNYQIKIILNNKDKILTTTNKDGIFEKEITGLEDGENVIRAYVLDSDGEEIGKSREILIRSDLTMPLFNKLILTPGGEVQVRTKILAEVYATEGLEEVSILVNDSINILKEDRRGIYKGEFLAPKEEGKYKIDITLKNELGHIVKVKEEDEVFLRVIPSLETAPEIEERVKDKCKQGDYSGDVFDGECGEEPEEGLDSPMDLGIRNLKIVKLKTKSVLTWDKLEDAVKYEVYKKLTGDELELIDTIYKPRYEILITGEEIKYEYFAVKAIGKKVFVDTEDETKTTEKEIIGDLSEAVKIQTGPEVIFIILIALLTGFGLFIISRKKI